LSHLTGQELADIILYQHYHKTSPQQPEITGNTSNNTLKEARHPSNKITKWPEMTPPTEEEEAGEDPKEEVVAEENSVTTTTTAENQITTTRK